MKRFSGVVLPCIFACWIGAGCEGSPNVKRDLERIRPGAVLESSVIGEGGEGVIYVDVRFRTADGPERQVWVYQRVGGAWKLKDRTVGNDGELDRVF